MQYAVDTGYAQILADASSLLPGRRFEESVFAAAGGVSF